MTHHTLCWVFSCLLLFGHSPVYIAYCLAIYTSQLFPPLSPSVRLIVLALQTLQTGEGVAEAGQKIQTPCRITTARMAETARQHQWNSMPEKVLTESIQIAQLNMNRSPDVMT